MTTKLTKLVSDFETQLAAKTSAGSTTGTLQGYTDDDGNALPTGQYIFAVDTDNSQKEYWLATLGSNGALTSIYTVSRQGTQTSGSAREHRVGAKVKITDWANIKYLTDLLTGATDLDASDPLKYDATATISDDAHLATKKYVDDTANAGAANASTTVKGIFEEATEAEINAGTASGGTSARLAINPSTLATSNYGTRLPSSDEKAALDGTGTPTGLNKYVTEDTLTTVAAAKAPVANYQLFTADGTWTKPAGTTGNERVFIQCWGAGGGGGSASGSGSQNAGGGGGGGGAYREVSILASALSATVAVTVGTSAADTAGGNTSFGTHLVAYGGGAGASATSGGAGAGGGGGGGGGFTGPGSSAADKTSGSGGTGAAGGSPGGSAANTDNTGFGGAGGADNTTPGNAIYGGGGGGGCNDAGATGGNGGNSIYGGGGGGAGENAVGGTGGTSTHAGAGGAGGGNAAGSAGSVPAGGGGGGGRSSTGTNAGGAGGRGECRVWLYY